MKSLLTASGLQLAKQIRNKEVSARDVVEAHIKHAINVNPNLNAIINDRFDSALKEAENADHMVKTMPPELLPPFLGVPGTIKECLAFTGMPQTAGLVYRKNTIPEKDATVVMRYRQAGIIPIGITNVPEGCMWIETDNKLYGRTNNPYNLTRCVGGSSGGEGAIIGAGASPLGLGSDLAGSLRFPALFNGIFSHKPSFGLVPVTGHFPEFSEKMKRYLSIGPMARKAEDLWPLLQIIRGPDGVDASAIEMNLGQLDTVQLPHLHFISVETNGIVDPSADLLEAQRKALNFLSSTGAQCKTMKFDKLRYSFQIITNMFTNDGGLSLDKLLGNGKKLNLYLEILRSLVGASEHYLPSLIVAAQDNFYSNRVKQKYVDMGRELKQEIFDALGENGVLLFPTYSRPAPKHLQPLFLINHWTYSAIFNVLQLPVTQVPLGLNADGLPLGVQIVSKPGNDHITIAVALELEKAFGGWVPPTMF